MRTYAGIWRGPFVLVTLVVFLAVKSPDAAQREKERFDAEGISIPFPQRDVHVHSESAST